MSTHTEPAAETSAKPGVLSADLPLRVFTAMGTTVVIAWLGLPTKYALLGVALAAFVADVFKWLAERFRLGKARLLALTLLFFLLGKDKAEAAGRRRTFEPARVGAHPGWRTVAVAGVAASATTVALFTSADLALGESVVADRKFTFFSPAAKEPDDDVAPRIVVPPDLVVEARRATAVEYRVTASDDTADIVVPTCAPRSGATFPIGRTVVACAAVDAAGNRSSARFAVTVRERDQPIVFKLPAEVRVEAQSSRGARVGYPAEARDEDGREVAVACSPPARSVFQLGRSIVTCFAAAGADRVRGTFAVVVEDTRGPAIALPEEIRVGDAGGDGKRVDYPVSATDAVDGRVRASCSPPPGSLFALGETRVVCRAADSRGNDTERRFLVVVVDEAVEADTTAPDIALGQKVVEKEATSREGAQVEFVLSAHDNRDGDVDVSCSPPSGSTFPIGSNRTTCSAIDAAGNRATRTLRIVVHDRTAPALRLPTTVVEEATSAEGSPVQYAATAIDLVDGPVTPVCSTPSGARFQLGDTSVNCRARDRHGNQVDESFTVTVRDTTAPLIRLAGDARAEAAGPSGAAVRFGISALDLVDGRVAPTCTGSRKIYPLGQTTIGCVAVDERGNERKQTFTIEVVDTQGPVIAVPGELVREARSSSGADVTFHMSASDLVSGPAAVICAPGTGSRFPLGRTTVKCSASDARGNPAERSFDVVVRDTTPPSLRVADIERSAASENGTVVAWRLVAFDAVDVRIYRVLCNPPSRTLFAEDSSTTVNCEVRDRAGNLTRKSFTVTIGAWSDVD